MTDNGTKQKNRIMAALAGVMQRTTFARKAGIQYGGARDVYQAAGYPPQGAVEFSHYWGLYERNELAARIVDLKPKTTWRTPPKVAEEDKATDETEFGRAFNKLAKRLRLWHYLYRADVGSGIGRYGILLIGVRGVDDTGLSTPLGRLRGPEDIVHLTPYVEGNAEINQLNQDPGSPRFMQPETYKLRLSAAGLSATGSKSLGSKTTLVHASRCIHIAEGKLEDEIYGRPRLQRVLNRLFDLDKIAACTGESYWQLASRILQAEIDPDATTTEQSLDDLEEAMGEIVHDLRRQYIGKGSSLSWMGGEVAPVKDIGDFFFSLIAAGADGGIPKRILFGSELGVLASTTDQQTFFGSVNERQEQFAEPDILRALIDRLIEVNALPRPQTGDYQVVWPTLFEDPDKDVAEANARTAEAASKLAGLGGDPLGLVEIDEDGRVYLVAREPGDAHPGLLDTAVLPGDQEERDEDDEPEEDDEEDELEDEPEE